MSKQYNREWSGESASLQAAIGLLGQRNALKGQMSQPGEGMQNANSPIEQDSLSRRLQDAHDQMQVLINHIEGLCSRLEPVLLPEQPPPEQQGTPASIGSPLMHLIDAIADRITYCQCIVLDVIRRAAI
jgi:hypothetical protein